MFWKKRAGVLKASGDEPIFTIEARPRAVTLPEFKDARDVNIRYPLLPPYAYAHIFWDTENKELVYVVEEPILTDDDRKVLSFLEDGIKELINISFISVKEGETVIRYLEKNINVLLSELGIKLSTESYLKLMYYIYRDFVGMNEIEPFLADYYVEDVECNGANSPIYLVHRKYRNVRTNVIFTSATKLSNMVEKLAQKCGKYISYANPLLDGSLPDGSRVNATFATDVSSKGPTFTLRKFTKEPWTPTRLIEMGTVSPEILAYLWLTIEYESNIMIIGGTASGKTTLLNALAFFIPPQARVVSIEDTRELNLHHENWLPSVSREGIGLAGREGNKYGEVSLFDLLKESFRQNPDYVIVGEVRGAEAYVLFQGASAGHPSFSTMHANSVGTMIRRLETPPINLSASLVNSLDVVCVMTQTKLGGKEVRRLREVDEIVDVKEGIGNYTINVPFIWDARNDRFYYKTESHIFNKLYVHYGVTKGELEREFMLRAKLLFEVTKQKIFGFREVQEIINAYYKTPQTVLKKFGVI